MFDFFYYYGYGYFSYLIFMLPALVISLWAQISVKSTFHKYSGLRTGRGLTGAQAAQEVLRFHNVMGVRCERVAGQLTDHFEMCIRDSCSSGSRRKNGSTGQRCTTT